MHADGRPRAPRRKWTALLHPTPELVGFRKALWGQATRVGAVASPFGEVLHTGIELSSGGVLPGQAVLGAERRHIRESAVAVFLQTHAAATRHFRHLIDREQQQLAVVADHGDGIAANGGKRAGFVWRFDVQDLLALAGIADAVVLIHDEALSLMACDQELASARVDE